MCCRMPRNVKRSGEAMTDNTQCHHAHDGHSGHDVKVSAGDKRYDKVPAGYSGAVYTCPMHPQVRQTSPGSCPICGMGLELESAAMAEEGSNPELVDFTRRFWIRSEEHTSELQSLMRITYAVFSLKKKKQT